MSPSTVRPRLLAWDEASAVLGFGLQALLPVLMMGGILLFIVQMPGETVLDRILPATCLLICLGTLYNAWLARRLAIGSGRTDVAALPSGISPRHMIVSTFVVMWPVADRTHDPMAAWSAGLAWTFIHGIVLVAGGLLARWLRRVTPRAALLGALSGA
ncbi:MAG: regulator, partial [Alphaproteobacteria bacterium]|nr:regulator [Alphaproteobacteria bacterium]